MNPKFIPLNRQYYEAFFKGEKSTEFRRYGPGWTESTCQIGRRVTLSLGYGKHRRLRGVLVSFDTIPNCDRADFVSIYGPGHTAAALGIKLDREQPDDNQWGLR